VGYECERLRTQADDFYTDHAIKDKEDRVAALNDKIVTLPQRIVDAQNAYVTARADAIEENVDKIRVRQQEIGLLERLRTLGALTKENSDVHHAVWALSIFLVLVDSLPVLLKVWSGTTPYDRRVAGQLRLQEGIDRDGNQTESHRNSADQIVKRHQIAADSTAQRHKIDNEAEPTGRQLNMEQEKRIAARVTQLLGRDPASGAAGSTAEA